MAYRAVIFDLGGVVFPSPFDAFDAYERGAGLPPRFIRTVVAASAEDGAWARFERSELDFAAFCAALEAECADAGGTIDAAALMQGIGTGFAPRPEMLRAIGRLRDGGLRVGALTNNWARPDSGTLGGPMDLGFDTVVESAVEGIRKPDPRIYALVCERLEVTPQDCVFLDDLGMNLKPARAMGMTTIKVVDATEALVELGEHLGLDLGRGLMELLVIRHAEPIRVTAEESGGAPADPELTERGRDQAARLGGWLGEEGVDHVVSSPLRRATETATPLAEALGLEIAIDDQLREYDAHSDSYIPIEELRERKDDRWQAMVEGRWQDFGGEAPDVFRARIVTRLDALITEHPGERVAVVCHGGVINVYLAALLEIDRHLWFDPGYTSISRVRASRGGARSIGSINELAHLVGRWDAGAR